MTVLPLSSLWVGTGAAWSGSALTAYRVHLWHFRGEAVLLPQPFISSACLVTAQSYLLIKVSGLLLDQSGGTLQLQKWPPRQAANVAVPGCFLHHHLVLMLFQAMSTLNTAGHLLCSVGERHSWSLSLGGIRVYWGLLTLLYRRPSYLVHRIVSA